MITEFLVKEDFKEWLESHAIGQFVGAPGYPTNCPIARFLNTKVDAPGDKVIAVGGTVICFADFPLLDSPVNEEEIPSWAYQFIRQVDKHFSFMDKQVCLRILESIDAN